MRSQALRSAAIRVGALRLLLLAIFAVLAARAGQLAVLGADARQHGERQIHTRISLPSARGLILDRTGRELAISVDAPSVFVLPTLLEDRAHAARELARILGLDRAALHARIVERDAFTFVARWVSAKAAREIEALELAGVGIEREPRRTYPAGRLAAPLLGFANIDGQGVRGLEQMLDAWLRGEPRTLGVERDARGRLLSSGPLNPRDTSGGDVLLSIDSGLQGEAEEALARAVEEFGAKGGVVIAIDPKTGDVLSLAEAPGFDPNTFRQTAYAQTRSRAFLDAIEPGSTMKAFLIAAALESGGLDPTAEIDTEGGEMRVRGKTIRDHHDYGPLDPAGVLRYSSNVGSVKIAQALGPQGLYDALRRFGFGSDTGSGFPTESAGLLRSWEDWKPVDHATHAFGQGMNVTPIQLAMACAALANGGERMQPRLVIARRRSMQAWEPIEPISLGRAAEPETIATLLPMLETVVSDDGTGRLAGLAGVRVAGKTGTAQKLDMHTRRYSQTKYTAWFMGVAPADDPRIAIVVGLDEPSGARHTGGNTAAPLFAEVAAAHLAHAGIVTRPEPIEATRTPQVEDDRRGQGGRRGRDAGAHTEPAQAAGCAPEANPSDRRGSEPPRRASDRPTGRQPPGPYPK